VQPPIAAAADDTARILGAVLGSVAFLGVATAIYIIFVRRPRMRAQQDKAKLEKRHSEHELATKTPTETGMTAAGAEAKKGDTNV